MTISQSNVGKLQQALQSLREIGFVYGDPPFNDALDRARSELHHALSLVALRKQQEKDHLAWRARSREHDERTSR